MEHHNGIVMERDGRHVILMTPLGEFKRVRVAGRLPDIGEEFSMPIAHTRFFSASKASWLGVAAAVILVLTASPLLNIISSPQEKPGSAGVAVTGKENIQNAVEVADITVVNAAEQQPDQQSAAQAAQDKTINPKQQEAVAIAKEDGSSSLPAASGNAGALPSEVQSAAKPQLGITGLKTDRNYLNPINGTGTPGNQSGSTGVQTDPAASGSVLPTQSDTAVSEGQTAADEDTKTNYMGEELPGDRDAGSGLDSHLQKPNF